MSPYLAFKAFGTGPQPCMMYRCIECDVRFYDRGLSETESDAYYSAYRDETYFVERNRFEPFYTRAVHDGLTEHMSSEERRVHLAKLLGDRSFETVIDFGGGDGSMISSLPATKRVSFDPSNVPARPGVEIIKERNALPSEVDLITCAQVLEHVTDPAAMVKDMLSLLRAGGYLYLEVPDQLWTRITPMRPGNRFVSWLSRNPKLLLLADIYSTAFRVKLGMLPPFGFVPMREHINFFSAASLRAIVDGMGLLVAAEGRTDDPYFYILAQKP
ncbi:class I SAM-dependent methyltransferase [Sphingobium sp. PNB]|uniref:class I SAM-dependent methyltransferase n=1 Tax=Sphingobium sp. PNB TaxID=863934 RepID=UPI001CA3E136|nr:class I SAM-dependent methyltransferase [Sphingobium sp. PNB]MCB4860802.1 class I SAM-dependent methyltransferase [Sphingobium sp. PNB]